MPVNIIEFDTHIGRQKPENIIHKNNRCPFCDRSKLTNIIEARQDMLLIKNKYNVLIGTEQLVLIEGYDCNTDMPQYPKEKMRGLIRFGMEIWDEMLLSNNYASVAFFKNYGPYSGGTIRHPHMQLVGFPELNTSLIPSEQEFEGDIIAIENNVILNISTSPRIGFWELNIIPNKLDNIDTVADFIQISVDFFMNKLKLRSQSYNIFFYNHNGNVCVKVLPRFATSPMYIGYNIKLLPTNISEIKAKIKHIYF